MTELDRAAPIADVESAALAYLADADRDAWALLQVALAGGCQVVEIEPGEAVLVIPDHVRFGPLGTELGRARGILATALRFAGDAVAELELRRPALIEPTPRQLTAEERAKRDAERLRRFVAHRAEAERAEAAGGPQRPEGPRARIGAAWAVLVGRAGLGGGV